MKKWWMESVGYQIYPKSFYDTNNDGIGDLRGIIEKLPYLNELGINLIWICPFYDSPMDDNGYDVRDFFNVAKEFGTIDDFKVLIHEAKKIGIKIILDFVLNHTSDEHRWFIESKSSVSNPKRAYYIWQEERKDNKIKEPTNWGSFFGGSAWKKDSETNMYYMKIFSDKMPDLNWDNADVRREMIDVGKWWLDLGIDGFRIDAVSHLDRASFIDSMLSEDIVLDWNKFSNLPKVHEYLKEMNEKLFSKYNALTIGEVGGAASIDSALKYSAFDQNELSMVFNFDHNWCNNLGEINDYKDLKTNVAALKTVFNNWQLAFENKGWLPLNWLNHDQPRLMSQYGNMTYFNESAKMLATAVYLMRGTPFIYQGEEIGMTNYPFKSIDEFRDVSSLNQFKNMNSNIDINTHIFNVAKTSRDNPRTPMQWDKTTYAGFSNYQPWINVNPNYHMINVENNIKSENSILKYYQKIIKLRRFSEYKDLIVYGKYRQIDLENNEVYIYERFDENKMILVINSFSDKILEYNLNDYIVETEILCNYKNIKFNEKNNLILMPFMALVLQVRRKK